MKIAITGAGGFLGTEILRQLSGTDNIIYAFTFDFERERDTFVKSENIIPVDNSKAEAFDYSDIDVLLNCAFPRNADDESFASGLEFIQRIFLKSASDGVGSIINISSQSVYSQKREKPADESFPIVLESKYAVGKYATELLLNSLCLNKIRHTNIRLASLIGAGFNQRITNKFALKTAAGEQITITGGNQLFGFLDVRDAASGIISIMQSSNLKWQEQYNLGTNKAYSLREIAECSRSTGMKYGYIAPEIIINNNDDSIWQNSSLICDRFFNDFNYKPAYALEDTLENIYALIKSKEA